MMLRESGPKPFTMSPSRAADLIGRGLDRDQAAFVFALMTRIGGLLPDRLRRWTMRPFPLHGVGCGLIARPSVAT